MTSSSTLTARPEPRTTAAPRRLPARAARTVRSRLATGGPERGDVPGWVLVTLMSALLVVALIGVAKGQLTSVFQNAISSVSNP